MISCPLSFYSAGCCLLFGFLVGFGWLLAGDVHSFIAKLLNRG